MWFQATVVVFFNSLILFLFYIIKKAIDCQKSIYFCLTNYAKAFDFGYHHKLWKILKKILFKTYKEHQTT